jgi:hypothetical protein
VPDTPPSKRLGTRLSRNRQPENANKKRRESGAGILHEAEDTAFLNWV